MKSKLAIIPVFLLAAGLLCGAALISCAGMEEKQELTDFALESLAMAIGYELRGDFEWTDEVEVYYQAIQSGKISLDGAQAAEGYLRTVTHPLIANRLVALAGMVGFSLNDLGAIVGVDEVEIPYLQAAARGFRMGLELD